MKAQELRYISDTEGLEYWLKYIHDELKTAASKGRNEVRVNHPSKFDDVIYNKLITEGFMVRKPSRGKSPSSHCTVISF